MQPSEAIPILKDLSIQASNAGFLPHVNAIELGIHALQLLDNPTDPRLIYARKLLLGAIQL